MVDVQARTGELLCWARTCRQTRQSTRQTDHTGAENTGKTLSLLANIVVRNVNSLNF